MGDFQLGKIVPIEAAIARDEFIGVIKGVGGDEEVGDNAMPRFGRQFAVFEEDAAGEVQVAPAERRKADLHALERRFSVLGGGEIEGGFGGDDRADDEGTAGERGIEGLDGVGRVLGGLPEDVYEDVGIEGDGHGLTGGAAFFCGGCGLKGALILGDAEGLAGCIASRIGGAVSLQRDELVEETRSGFFGLNNLCFFNGFLGFSG